jgi:hypothetical protein
MLVPSSKILDGGPRGRLTSIQRVQIDFARCERLGQQISFVECLHDPIDLSLNIYGIVSLITVWA